MEQVPGVTSTVGLFHTIRVKLSSSGGAAMLQIWVDEVPLMPLTHGQLLANGKTCELPSLDQGRFLGFAANNGQGAFAKPLFRGLQVLAQAGGDAAQADGGPKVDREACVARVVAREQVPKRGRPHDRVAEARAQLGNAELVLSGQGQDAAVAPFEDPERHTQAQPKPEQGAPAPLPES